MDFVIKVKDTRWTRFLVWWYTVVLGVARDFTHNAHADGSVNTFVGQWSGAWDQSFTNFMNIWNNGHDMGPGIRQRGVLADVHGFIGPVLALVIHTPNGLLRVVYGRKWGSGVANVYLTGTDHVILSIQKNQFAIGDTHLYGGDLLRLINYANAIYPQQNDILPSVSPILEDFALGAGLTSSRSSTKSVYDGPRSTRASRTVVSSPSPAIAKRRSSSSDDFPIGNGLPFGGDAFESSGVRQPPVDTDYAGNGGGFSGAGASAGWSPSPEPTPAPSYTPSYSPSDTGGSSDSGSSSFTSSD